MSRSVGSDLHLEGHRKSRSEDALFDEERESRLDAALQRGIADVEAGRVMPADEVRARFIEKYEAMLASSA